MFFVIDIAMLDSKDFNFDAIGLENMNLANALTVARLVILPFIIALMFIPAAWAAAVALTLYIVGAITDWLDGYVARKYDQITELGTFLDPICDKVYVVTIMMMLIATDRINGVFVLLPIAILTREFLIAGLREYLGPKNIKLPVSGLAKWKTTLQMAALGILIIAPYIYGFTVLGTIALVGATIITLITGWDYLKTGLQHLNTETLITTGDDE